jgi:hypothetical protein
LLLVALPGQLTGWWERTSFFKDFLMGMVTLATCAAIFPVAIFVCVGQIDERGTADTAIAFAGRNDVQNETDNKSAANPFRKAVELYREGQVKKILLIARPSEPGPPDETAQILRRAAVAAGIAEADLLAPPAPSKDSRTSLDPTAQFLGEQKIAQVVIVARFFEVPRIKLTLQRAGLDAHAVPIREDIRAAYLRPLLFREAVALWACYVQPLSM